MSDSATTGPAPKRSIEEIEADLARTREEMAETLGVLADKVNPKLQAARVSRRTQEVAEGLEETARATANTLGARARRFKRDVSRRKPEALGLLALVAGVAITAVVVMVKHRG
jgi:hypothetical protein